jgi:hypothetical protein
MPEGNINAKTDGPAKGLQKLGDLLVDHINSLTTYGIAAEWLPTIINQTRSHLWLWKQQERNEVVEQWYQFWLYRKDGELVWHIKIETSTPTETRNSRRDPC